jgi:hypothetical protein
MNIVSIFPYEGMGPDSILIKLKRKLFCYQTNGFTGITGYFHIFFNKYILCYLSVYLNTLSNYISPPDSKLNYVPIVKRTDSRLPKT